MSAPKVNKLQTLVLTKHDIVRLDVPMRYLNVLVKVV
jgi:hypothetical protein